MGARALELLRGVEERLRGDAAHVQAGAAVALALLHHGGLEAELRGADRAHIAAGASSDDDEIVGHVPLPQTSCPGTARASTPSRGVGSREWPARPAMTVLGPKAVSTHVESALSLLVDALSSL